MFAGDVDALALAALAVVLAWPAPVRLASARWPVRCPRSALLLWQSIGLAGGLAAIGALLSAGLAPLASRLPEALWRAVHGGVGALPLWRDGILVLAVALAAWLLGVLTALAASTTASRRRQRALLDLVADPGPDGDSVVLDHRVPTAYSVPGLHPRVVISRATLACLSSGELCAVLAHERAHLRAHHDLVLHPFVAWQRTFPFLRTARTATRAVALLVELLADEAAAAAVSHTTTAGALARLGDTELRRAPGRVHAEPTALAARLDCLSAPPAAASRATLAVTYLTTAALVLLPTVELLRPWAG